MSYLRGLTLRFALVVFLALTACLAVTSHFASQSFENALLPEIEGKAVYPRAQPGQPACACRDARHKPEGDGRRPGLV